MYKAWVLGHGKPSYFAKSECFPIHSRPATVLKAISKLSGNMSFEIVDVVPPREAIDSMLSALHTEPTDVSLSLLSPLLPLSSSEKLPRATGNFDLDGYSTYARIISLLLDALIVDRIAAKTNPWVLRHFVALSIYAEEVFNLPDHSSEVFDIKVISSSILQQLPHKVQQVAAYVLSDVGDGRGWHKEVTASCIDPRSCYDGGEIGKLVVNLIQAGTSSDNPRDARILHTILQHILSHASKQEAALWMGVCRKLETKGT